MCIRTCPASFEEALHNFWKQIQKEFGSISATLFIEIGDTPDVPALLVCKNSEFCDENCQFSCKDDHHDLQTEHKNSLQQVVQSWANEENKLSQFLIALKRKSSGDVVEMSTLSVWKATVDDLGLCKLASIHPDDVKPDMMDFLKDLLECDEL